MSAPDLIIKQLSEIISDLDDAPSETGYVEDYDARRISTRARAAIRRYAPPGSAYEDDATEVANSPAGDQWKAQQFTAIVHGSETTMHWVA